MNTRLAGKRALLVDDDADARKALRLFLDYFGMDVTEAENGEAALDLFKAWPFDFVVTDYQMPGLRGDELATEIKAIRSHCRVVVVSGHASVIMAEGKLTQNIDTLIEKPCKLGELAVALDGPSNP